MSFPMQIENRVAGNTYLQALYPYCRLTVASQKKIPARILLYILTKLNLAKSDSDQKPKNLNFNGVYTVEQDPFVGLARDHRRKK